MQAELAASLRHLSEVARGEIADLLGRPLDLLGRGAALPPAGFGWYYALGEALILGDGDLALAAARDCARSDHAGRRW